MGLFKRREVMGLICLKGREGGAQLELDIRSF